MTAPDAMNPVELTKKLKSARKRLRALERDLGSEIASNEKLEERVKKLEGTQNTLMHNLRRVLSEMKLRPEFPKS